MRSVLQLASNRHASQQQCGCSDTTSLIALIGLALIKFRDRDIGFLRDYMLISLLLCVFETIFFLLNLFPQLTSVSSFLSSLAIFPNAV